MKLNPECSLVTYQFQVGDDFINAVTKDDNAKNRFTNFMAKTLKNIEAPVFAKFAGAYVWISVFNPHGRFIGSHEVIRDAIALYAKEML